MKYLVKYHDKGNYSQGGEAGIIKFLLDALEIKSGWCVDIGAYDGKFCSNILDLVEWGFDAVMIEADPAKFAKLKQTEREYSSITAIHAEVKPSNVQTLIQAPIPADATHAVLNIDIDGGEPEILVGIKYKFAVVVMEWKDYGAAHPWSVLLAAEACGYRFAYCTNSNLIFVDADLYPEMCRRLIAQEDAWNHAE